MAFVDTPGIHEAKGALNRPMVEAALAALEDADVVLFLVEPSLGPDGKTPAVTPGVRAILERLAAAEEAGAPGGEQGRHRRPSRCSCRSWRRSEQLRPFDEVLLVSALTGDGVEELLRATLGKLPEGPPLFDAETFTDQQEVGLAAELIREQVLRHCRQEVPHSVGGGGGRLRRERARATPRTPPGGSAGAGPDPRHALRRA